MNNKYNFTINIFFILILIYFVCLSVNSHAEILVLQPNGQYIKKSDLKAAAMDIDTIDRKVLVTSAYIVPIGFDWPKNRTLEIETGGLLTVQSGTMNIKGNFIAPLSRVFAGNGKIVFYSGSVREVYPQWWGAYSDNSHPTETTNAIQNAIYSSPTSKYGPSGAVYFHEGIYSINNTIIIDRWGIRIGGNGASSIINNSTPNLPALKIIGIEQFTLENIAIDGDAKDFGTGGTTGNGIELWSAQNSRFNNVYIRRHGGHGVYIRNGNWLTHFTGCYILANAGDGINAVSDNSQPNTGQNGNNFTVTNSLLGHNAGDGIKWAAASLNLSGNDFEGNMGSGVHIDAKSATQGAYGFNISGNYFEQNGLGQIRMSASGSNGLYRPIDGGIITGNYLFSNKTGAMKATSLIIGNTYGYYAGIKNVYIGYNMYSASGDHITHYVDLDSSSTSTTAISTSPLHASKFRILGDGVVQSRANQ